MGEGENGDRTSALKPNGSERQSEFLASHVIGPSIYHFGIVDFLQDWTFEKEMERNFKITVGRNDPEGISVMEPIPYKLRFQSKMDQIFALDDDPVVSGIPPLPGMLSPSTRSAVGLENILHAQVKRGREGSIVNPLLLESAGVALDNDSPPRSLQQQHSSSQLEHSQEEDTRPVQGTNEPDPWKEDQDATF